MSFRVGRIHGITINVHYSLLLIFFLITWSLALGYMPQQFPGLPQVSYWLIGVLSGLLLVASIIIHELCHSIVANRLGIPVKRITLFFLGGASELPEEPPSPGVEFKMAVVGPLSSLAVAAVLGSLWGIFRTQNLPIEAVAITQYGTYLNLILGVFNLIPAFPMDGGRIFRSALWRLGGSVIKATRQATKVGVWISYAFMFGGFLMMIFGGFFSGLWMIFIGWFIKTSAEAGLSQTLISRILSKTTVGEIMSPGVVSVSPDLSLNDLVHHYFLKMRFAGYPVVDDGSVLGMVTMDMVKNAPSSRWGEMTVREVMKPLANLAIVEPETSASDAMYLMSRMEEGRALVMRGGRLLGILSRKDFTHLINVRAQLERE